MLRYFLLPLLACLAAQVASAAPLMFTTVLSPGNEVPPVVSDASGTAKITFLESGSVLDGLEFELVLDQITSPLLQGHIHIAAPDTNGPIAANLFVFCANLILGECVPGETEVFGGNLMLRGTIDVSDLQGGFTFQAILEAILSNDAYVNVHTEDSPTGEIRGNLVPEPHTLVMLTAGLGGLTFFGGTRRRAP